MIFEFGGLLQFMIDLLEQLLCSLGVATQFVPIRFLGLFDFETGLHAQFLGCSEIRVALRIDVAFRFLCDRDASTDQRHTQCCAEHDS